MLGLYHCVDGIYGYHEKNGVLKVILRVINQQISAIKIIYNDPFDWSKK